jgi:hypothetical protein
MYFSRLQAAENKLKSKSTGKKTQPKCSKNNSSYKQSFDDATSGKSRRSWLNLQLSRYKRG